MKIYLYILLISLSLSITQIASASYPLNGYEMIITESLSEGITLDMTLSKIAKAKKNSRIGATKKSLYQLLTKRLSPLLSGQAMANDYNLFELATSLPIEALMNDLLELEAANSGSAEPADFLIAIVPQLPKSSQKDELLPFSPLYAQSKASVIDNPERGFNPRKSYSEHINSRVLDSLFLAYKRNYIDYPESNEAFFAGALLNIHLEGPQSWIRVQVMGGLPTLPDKPFAQEAKEAKFELLRFPNAPTYRDLTKKQFPGAIIDLTYQPGRQEKPVALTIKFGSLGLMDDRSFEMADQLEPTEDQTFGMVASFFHQYNVPNLFGVPLEAYSPKVDPYLQWAHNIQLNIHEVEVDLAKIEITKIRTTIDLPSKSKWWIDTPTLEMDSVSQTVTEKGNEAIAPYKDKIEAAINVGVDGLLQQPQLRADLFNLLKGLMDSHAKTNQDLTATGGQ